MVRPKCEGRTKKGAPCKNVVQHDGRRTCNVHEDQESTIRAGVQLPIPDPAPSSETAEHAGTKMVIYNRLKAVLVQSEPLPVSWKCLECDQQHIRNLLSLLPPIDGVAEEQWWPDKGIKPDITLLAGKEPRALIEIIVGHRPAYQPDQFDVQVITVKVQRGSDPSLMATGTVPIEYVYPSRCPEQPKTEANKPRPLSNAELFELAKEAIERGDEIPFAGGWHTRFHFIPPRFLRAAYTNGGDINHVQAEVERDDLITNMVDVTLHENWHRNVGSPPAYP